MPGQGWGDQTCIPEEVTVKLKSKGCTGDRGGCGEQSTLDNKEHVQSAGGSKETGVEGTSSLKKLLGLKQASKTGEEREEAKLYRTAWVMAGGVAFMLKAMERH